MIVFEDVDRSITVTGENIFADTECLFYDPRNDQIFARHYGFVPPTAIDSHTEFSCPLSQEIFHRMP